MNFSKYKLPFMILSLAGIIGMLAVTFGVHKGFARSITFNGGIRLSIMMPAGQGKAEIQKAVDKAGYKNSLSIMGDISIIFCV